MTRVIFGLYGVSTTASYVGERVELRSAELLLDGRRIAQWWSPGGPWLDEELHGWETVRFEAARGGEAAP